jgi:hypothetical protein
VLGVKRQLPFRVQLKVPEDAINMFEMPTLGIANYVEISETSNRILTRPILTAHRSIPISSW